MVDRRQKICVLEKKVEKEGCLDKEQDRRRWMKRNRIWNVEQGW